MGRLDGKAILVIGGAQGIGRGCVLAAASEGARLVIGDVNEPGARDVAQEAAARGAEAIGMACDVVEREQVEAVVHAAQSAYGRVDGLVNLAYAHDGPAPLAELSTESLSHELHVDVVGGLIAMQAVYPHLRGPGGSIVNFSSGAGVEGLAGRAAYSSAKAAVRLLSRTAALEWGAEGIRVNCVCPFSMSPSLIEAVRAGTVDQTQLDAVSPLGRAGDPERDIGAGVAFLLSDDARYVTGQTFMLDGGGLAL
jgi:NAD(P)-dependent dehydrogenase (short-subunit alcohol dehydrogenase family)